MTVRSEQRTIYTTTCDCCGAEQESARHGATMTQVTIVEEYKHVCGKCWDAAFELGGSQSQIHERIIAAYKARQKELGA
jgi:hypothetical protein